MRETYLVCYDICNDRRHHHVHDHARVRRPAPVLGVRMSATAADLARCRHQLGRLIDHTVDQVIFVVLGPVEGRGERVITAIGKPYSPFDSPCIVVDGEKD
jgi:CRISPR-associated protein Cas2